MGAGEMPKKRLEAI